MKEIRKEEKRRKPSMIKTPSSKPSIPVSTLTKKFEAQLYNECNSHKQLL